MSFVSYAQNFEDVVLYRALKHVSSGFYIDVGAASPDEYSVTKAFYERGWNGINIEPCHEYFNLLAQQRPRDTNLNLAAGSQGGAGILGVFTGTGLSTLNDAVKAAHVRSGLHAHERKVRIQTLNTIWKTHVPPGQQVHFLKIDVEGTENEVVQGNDWRANRPWIVVVEAHIPSSSVEAKHVWEPILLGAGYSMSYADGLNRFYLAHEQSELAQAFKYPPNVFDRFVMAAQRSAEERAKRAEEAEKTLAAVHSTISWKITAPLRLLKRHLLRLGDQPQ